MSEEKEIFDIKFVYLEWDDVLKGKKVLAGDNLQFMRMEVNDGTVKLRCVEDNISSSNLYPFKDEYGTKWATVYYDPLYDVKLAWKNGKQIQARSVLYKDAEWIDSKYPHFDDTCCEFRVKPEKTWRPFKDIKELKATWFTKHFPSIPSSINTEELLLEEPTIWVRSKANPACTRLITGFLGESNVEEQAVAISTVWNPLDALFKQWEFLDGTSCGVEE